MRGDACRHKETTATCVGNIKYFVSAVPLSEGSMTACQALGLPVQEQLFAVVLPYEVKDVQQSLRGVNAKTAWVKPVLRPLISSKVLHTGAEFVQLMAKVSQSSTVFAVGQDGPARLKHRWGRGPKLDHLAIPVSARVGDLYVKAAEDTTGWAVHPVVRVDPRREVTGRSTDKDPPALKAAVAASQRISMYFVHQYSSERG